MATRKALVGALLATHGRTFSEELGIDLARGTPSPLFRWLCACLLMSARISTDKALSASRALSEAGWTTPRKMADATWAQRVRVLNRSGYARYDESTSRMLRQTCDHLLDRYGGDLRRLREQAGRDPETERRLLKEFKGIGNVGADIFFREAQMVWEELYPFADRRALKAAHRLELGDSARALAALVPARDLPRLVSALVRLELANGYEEIKEAA